MGRSAIGTYQTIAKTKKALWEAEEKADSELFQLLYQVVQLKETLPARLLRTSSAKETKMLLQEATERVAADRKQLEAITKALDDAIWAYQKASNIVMSYHLLKTYTINRDLVTIEHFISICDHCLGQKKDVC